MNTIKTRNIVIGEGMPKICVPIVGKTSAELMQEVAELANIEVDIVEWRMDWFDEVESIEAVVEMLHELRTVLNNTTLLATFRSKKEGGEKEVSTAFYTELNKAVISTKEADLIDVELFTGDDSAKDIISCAKEHGVYVVMSNHDFAKTPAYEDIIARLTRMQNMNADILKIAVMPQSKNDVIELLRATNDMHELHAHQPIITMSMAGTGALSRMCGEVFGSSVTFGAAKKASAPGQMAVQDLKNVLEIVHKSI